MNYVNILAKANNVKIIEICTIIFIAVVLIAFIASFIYKKVKHIPTGECSCCSYKKQCQKNKKEEECSDHGCCCCHQHNCDHKEK